MAAANPLLPLVLDLDGTLIHTDTFHEMMARLFYTKPWLLILLPFWFMRGRPYAKRRLTELCDLSPQGLPYNVSLLSFAKQEAQKGRPLILATGSDQTMARKVAEHLGLFQEVIGSDGIINMTGLHKRQALLERFGNQGFDYAGDSLKDLYVWEVSRMALVVHPKKGVLKKVQTLKETQHIQHFPGNPSSFWSVFTSPPPQPGAATSAPDESD
jgi:phosphoserine phosphatase